MNYKTIQNGGKKLSYLVSGTGSCVVLLHGFGEDSSIWKKQCSVLENVQYIIPDLPGSGKSDLQEDMSLEGLAKSVQTILHAENVISCVMIGHSMGGYITLAFAELFPEQLNGLGLFHSTAFADSPEKIETRRKGIDFIRKNGASAFLKTIIPNLYAAKTKAEHPEYVEDQIKATSGFSEAALIAYYESMIKRPDRTGILKETSIPVLFILGKYDSAVTLQDGLKQVHLPNLSYIHILEKSGHMGMIEETETANEAITAYLKYINQHDRT